MIALTLPKIAANRIESKIFAERDWLPKMTSKVRVRREPGAPAGPRIDIVFGSSYTEQGSTQ